MATCAVVRPFDVGQFNLLPSIEECDDVFQRKQGTAFIDTSAKALLEKYALGETFGFGLLHRHFSLYPNEKLVEHNNVSVPWDDSPKSKEKKAPGSIVPDAWMVTPEGNLMPYEFSFSPWGQRSDVDYESKNIQSFITEFVDAVKEAGLDGILGLRRWPENFTGGLERTEGRANIMFLPGQYPEELDKGAIETMWFFPQVKQTQHVKQLPLSIPTAADRVDPKNTAKKAKCDWYDGECQNQGALPPNPEANTMKKSMKHGFNSSTILGPTPVNAKCSGYCASDGYGHGNCHTTTYERRCSAYCAFDGSEHGRCHTTTYDEMQAKLLAPQLEADPLNTAPSALEEPTVNGPDNMTDVSTGKVVGMKCAKGRHKPPR